MSSRSDGPLRAALDAYATLYDVSRSSKIVIDGDYLDAVVRKVCGEHGLADLPAHVAVSSPYGDALSRVKK